MNCEVISPECGSLLHSDVREGLNPKPFLKLGVLLCIAFALSLTGCTYNVDYVDSVIPKTGEDSISDVAADTHHAYYCKGNEFGVLDISHDGQKPVLISKLVLPEKAHVHVVSGSLVFLAGWYGSGLAVQGRLLIGSGLLIMDVSDPSAPRVAGRFGLTGCDAMTASGTRAYIADQGKLSIVDVSDPSTPSLLRSYEMPGRPFDIAVAQDKVLCPCGWEGLLIVDVSNPKTPFLAGTYRNGKYIRGVDARDSTAFVTSSWGPGSGRLDIVDLSEPSKPAFLASLDTSWLAHDVAVADSLAYVADGKGGMRVVDVSDKRSPQTCGSYRPWDTGSGKVAASGSFAFLISYVGTQPVSQLDIVQFKPGGNNIKIGVALLIVVLLISLLARIWMRKSSTRSAMRSDTPGPAPMDPSNRAESPASIGVEAVPCASVHRSRHAVGALLSILAGMGETLLVDSIIFIPYAVASFILAKRGIHVPHIWIYPLLTAVALAPIICSVRNAKRKKRPRAFGNVVALLVAIPIVLYSLLVMAFAIEGIP